MHFLDNRSIRTKLILAFGIILLCAIGLGAFCILRIALLDTDGGLLEDNSQGNMGLSHIARDGEIVARLAAETTSAKSAAQFAQIEATAAEVQKEYANAWSGYAPGMDPGDETRFGTGFNDAWMRINKTFRLIMQARQAGDANGEAALVDGDLSSGIADFDRFMTSDLAYQSAQTVTYGNAQNLASASSIRIVYGVLGLMVLATLLVCWLMVEGIAKPIAKMTGVMRRLAAQDFAVQIPGIGRKDELGRMAATVRVFRENGLEREKLEVAATSFQADLTAKLAEAEVAYEAAGIDQLQVVKNMKLGLMKLAEGDLVFRLTDWFPVEYKGLRMDFNQSIETLQATMLSISGNASGIHTGAIEITHASDDLARRTEQQAAKLEQTAASLERITATVRATATGAVKAAGIVATAASDAHRSGEIVRDTVQAMTEIDRSANQIATIVDVIDGIAFQTNLLALNAGVEAARAGDAGRGFAVVATEVRALAQRSATAAKEIKTLISNSAQQVATGVRLVGETGSALHRTVEHVTQLNELVDEISASAREQATALGEVNSAVSQMDQVTQQNAAMVEQATAASHNLAAEAQSLAKLVSQFRTAEDGAAVVTATRSGEQAFRAGSAKPSRPGLGKRVPADADLA
ncbi:methyl-accepting chemotaxis protein [Acidisoma sp.]|uniref:methyl-accepting chemotaxis protein n=1 Tax=Acidisoma sp. TaxID=1872115 RepID=UPI003B000D6E